MREGKGRVSAALMQLLHRRNLIEKLSGCKSSRVQGTQGRPKVRSREYAGQSDGRHSSRRFRTDSLQFPEETGKRLQPSGRVEERRGFYYRVSSNRVDRLRLEGREHLRQQLVLDTWHVYLEVCRNTGPPRSSVLYYVCTQRDITRRDAPSGS